jgi:serine protease Do
MKKRNILILIMLMIIGLVIFNKYSERAEVARELIEPDTVVHHSDNGQGRGDLNEQKIKDTQELNISRHNTITRAVQMIEPAVVSVNVIRTEIVRRFTDPFENPFFGFFDFAPYKRRVKAIGSGLIFNEEGYVITNSHVVEGATEIKIILTDGRQYDGNLIGTSNVQDIAIIKISGDNLPSAKFGKSSNLIIGEWAIAVGNPYGFLIKDSKPSVSVGVISAINRNFAEGREGKVYRKMIQTDAAINPGNSGGPLVNIYGEVIGINTFILSESGGSIGIGFAIPIDRVKKIAAELIRYGKIRDIWFGFKVQELNPMLAEYLNLKSTDGVLVAHVDKNGPAARAGMKKLDVIIEINDIIIKNTDDAELAVTDIAVGDKIRISILRNNTDKRIVIDAVESR